MFKKSELKLGWIIENNDNEMFSKFLKKVYSEDSNIIVQIFQLLKHDLTMRGIQNLSKADAKIQQYIDIISNNTSEDETKKAFSKVLKLIKDGNNNKTILDESVLEYNLSCIISVEVQPTPINEISKVVKAANVTLMKNSLYKVCKKFYGKPVVFAI